MTLLRRTTSVETHLQLTCLWCSITLNNIRFLCWNYFTIMTTHRAQTFLRNNSIILVIITIFLQFTLQCIMKPTYGTQEQLIMNLWCICTYYGYKKTCDSAWLCWDNNWVKLTCSLHVFDALLLWTTSDSSFETISPLWPLIESKFSFKTAAMKGNLLTEFRNKWF